MSQAINAYRQVSATDEFKEIERLRSRARHNEASALGHARREERNKWQHLITDLRGTVADKDAELADKNAVLADKDAALADKDAALADKDAALADKDAQIAELLAKLSEK